MILLVDASREAARLAPSLPRGRFSKSTGESIARREARVATAAVVLDRVLPAD
jgi:hypothetical protein